MQVVTRGTVDPDCDRLTWTLPPCRLQVSVPFSFGSPAECFGLGKSLFVGLVEIVCVGDLVGWNVALLRVPSADVGVEQPIIGRALLHNV